MDRILTFEQKRENYKNHGFADPNYCVRVLRTMGEVLPEALLEPDEDLGGCFCAELLDRCFDAEYEGVPRTFANCAANCDRLLDDDRYDDFDDLLYCMDRSMHDVFDLAYLSGTPLMDSPLRRTAKTRAEAAVSRFLLLSLDGLHDAELALAAESERSDIERARRRLLSPDMNITRPMGEEGPLRVIDAMSARYRKMKAGLDGHSNGIGRALMVLPFTLEKMRTIPRPVPEKTSDEELMNDEWVTNVLSEDIPF